MNRVKKMIFLSLLVSIGLGLSLVESSMPIPIPIPGARLGLSNIIVLVTIVVFGIKEGLIVSGLKSVILMLITGSVSSFIYSFMGAVLSCVVMYIVYKYFTKIFSLIGVSIFGALAHNFAQVTVASFILNNIKIYTYLPFLMLTSLFTGYFVGLGSRYIIRNLQKSMFIKNIKNKG